MIDVINLYEAEDTSNDEDQYEEIKFLWSDPIFGLTPHWLFLLQNGLLPVRPGPLGLPFWESTFGGPHLYLLDSPSLWLHFFVSVVVLIGDVLEPSKVEKSQMSRSMRFVDMSKSPIRSLVAPSQLQSNFHPKHRVFGMLAHGSLTGQVEEFLTFGIGAFGSGSGRVRQPNISVKSWSNLDPVKNQHYWVYSNKYNFINKTRCPKTKGLTCKGIITYSLMDSFRARLEHSKSVCALRVWLTSESAKQPDSNRVKMARVKTRAITSTAP